jgi:hypothetical protein
MTGLFYFNIFLSFMNKKWKSGKVEKGLNKL